MCKKTYGSALFQTLHALHPLVSYARPKSLTGRRQKIAECMKSFCGIELDKELEEIGSRDISALEEFVTEIYRRIENCAYLFKDIDIEFNENSDTCDETLKSLETKVISSLISFTSKCFIYYLFSYLLHRLIPALPPKRKRGSTRWRGFTKP